MPSLTLIGGVEQQQGEQNIAAYAAGFFDGEGHIALTKSNSKRVHPWGTYFYERFQLRIQISQNDPRPLWFLHQHFGGAAVRKSQFRRSYDQAKYTRYDWGLAAQQAGAFLRIIRPYLIVKADEADVALTFLDTIDLARRKTPSDVIKQREFLHSEMLRIRKCRA